jgi:hypothetical protein
MKNLKKSVLFSMQQFLLSIELRRLIKILIQKISSKTTWLLFKTRNFQFIPKNSSWIFLDRIGNNMRKLKIKIFKKLRGLIFLTNRENKCLYALKNCNHFKKKLNLCFFPISYSFFSPDSIFAFFDMKLIDSYFQLREKTSRLLPILSSIENFYGFLLSLSEISILLFQKLVHLSNIHRIFFTRIRGLIFEVIGKFINNRSKKKIKNFSINLLLCRKISL